MLPLGMLIEEIEGFRQRDSATGEVYLDVLVDVMLQIKNGEGKQHFVAWRVFPLDGELWVAQTRPRYLLIRCIYTCGL